MSVIMSVVNQSRIKNKIVILDCCDSGAFGEFGTGSYLESGVTILAAAERGKSAYDNDEGHGRFTGLLCGALDGGAADCYGNITIGGIYGYIEKSFSAMRQSQKDKASQQNLEDHPSQQRPVFKSNVSELVTLRTVKPKVEKQKIEELTRLFSSPDIEFKLDPSYERTNAKDNIIEPKKPYAIDANISKLKTLQKLESIGLVEPVGEEHMYYAAMNSKSCRLTELGKHYWYLVKQEQTPPDAR